MINEMNQTPIACLRSPRMLSAIAMSVVKNGNIMIMTWILSRDSEK
jgi:hypothetical protein